MPWVRLDDSFAEHPKIIGLSDGAFRTHVAALCYCNRHLTDGHIPAALSASSSATELIDAGLWEQNGRGYLIHDYFDYQPSRAEVEDQRAKKQAAGQAGGQASARARAKAAAQAKSKPVPVPKPKEKEPDAVHTEASYEANSVGVFHTPKNLVKEMP